MSYGKIDPETGIEIGSTADKYPEWLLPFFITVEDGEITSPIPPRKFQEKWLPTKLYRAKHIEAKYQDYLDKGRIDPPRDLHWALSKSWPYHSDLKHIHAISVILGIRPDVTIRLLEFRAKWNCNLYFIVADSTIVEIVSFRGLRQLDKKAMHIARELKFYGDEKERILAIGSMLHKKEIQGGLIRQEKRPRCIWK